MTATAPPAVPARPSRSSDKEAQQSAQAPEVPTIPARPVKKAASDLPRPLSSGRFAPSPLHGGIQTKNQRPTSSSSNLDIVGSPNEPIERPGSTALPSLGEEGLEYGALDNSSAESGTAPTEQTRTVSENLKLHAPKPSLPADSAKQQIIAVTRTDSARAASFGLGKPSQSSDRASSHEHHFRRPSSTFSLHSDHGNHTDEEHGIPVLGQRVPMSSHLGDVQAPSPALEDGKRNHNRKLSARRLPPGSYGLHGHGVDPQDKLEKAYYEKHPELVQKEQKHHHVHDHRQSDYAMSSNDLNRMVRDTSKRRPIPGHENEATAIPTEDVAYHASDEYAHRITTPQRSPRKEQKRPDFAGKTSPTRDTGKVDDEQSSILSTIHVNDSAHPEHLSFGDDNPDNTEEYKAPILAGDEIDAGQDAAAQHPAIRPGFDRSRSYDVDEPKKPMIYQHNLAPNDHPERAFSSTPLEDVEEYEPLFDEENKKEEQKQTAIEKKTAQHFPSKDIWEDAPSSVLYSTEVSTPELEEQNQRPRSKPSFTEGRSITPAQAFAQYQEELAEKESKDRASGFFGLSPENRQPIKPSWIDHQPHLAICPRPPTLKRFPSKDVWEDTPDCHIQEAMLSSSSPKDDTVESTVGKPDIPARPAKPAKKAEEELKTVPAIPDRPKPKQGSSDDDIVKQPPPISDKPKPQIPNRPVKKLSGDSKDGDFVKPPKPPVPNRPVGGKISAGFMSDLNKRLQLGPQAMKKEEPVEEDVNEEKEKAPLSDARKSRARGPQRRAPAKSAPPPVKEPTASVLTVSLPQTLWSIDPEHGSFVTSESGHDAGKDIKPNTSELEPDNEGNSVLPTEEASWEPSKTTSAVAGESAATEEHAELGGLAPPRSDVEVGFDVSAAKPAIVGEVDEKSKDEMDTGDATSAEATT